MKICLILLITIFTTLISAETIWEDDFEELSGWVLNGEFEIDSPQGLGGEHGNPDPTSAYGGSNVLGVDLIGLGASLGDYETDLGSHEYFAISPAIDCSEFVGVELTCMRWLNVEQPLYDHAYLDVSNDDGTTWIEVWTNSVQVTETNWAYSNYDITDIAELSGNVRIRFSIGSTDGSCQYSGWNIDNLVITGNQVVYGSIEGNVVDVNSSDPVAFATVMSQYGNTMSDDEGYFILNYIPTGYNEIMINALGYLPYNSNTIFVTGNDTVNVLCELMPNPNSPPSPQNLQAYIYDENNVHLTWEESQFPVEELLAYNVFRNGIILQSVLAEEYFDLDLINGNYSYYISAVYDSGESLPTDTVNVQINVVGLDNNILQNDVCFLSNYPNPFNPTTTISFTISNELHKQSELIIYNIKGQRIKTFLVILSGVEGRGVYNVLWNGTDQTKKPVTSGIYFYQLVIDGNIVAKNKMMLLK